MSWKSERLGMGAGMKDGERGEIDLEKLKPSQRTTDFPISYLTEHTGGSLRHKGIRAVDCQSALFDLNRDWEKYHRATIRELVGALEGLLDVSRCKNGCAKDDMTCATRKAEAVIEKATKEGRG